MGRTPVPVRSPAQSPIPCRYQLVANHFLAAGSGVSLLTSMADLYSSGPPGEARRRERERQSLYSAYILAQDRAADERGTSGYGTNTSRGRNGVPDRTPRRGVSPYPRASEGTGEVATNSRQALPNLAGSSSRPPARPVSTATERRGPRLVSFVDPLPRRTDRRPEGHHRSGESGDRRRSGNRDR
jgi:hypothetical protein